MAGQQESLRGQVPAAALEQSRPAPAAREQSELLLRGVRA